VRKGGIGWTDFEQLLMGELMSNYVALVQEGVMKKPQRD